MRAVYTIGHSTRALDEFIAILRAHGVEHLVDIRTVPRSARNPQYNRETMPDSLGREGIAYTHLGELGGLRRARKDSINTAWRNTSFRGYADYMQTPEFAAGLERLLEIARESQVAIMCAEAVPWRCHRSLVGDALLARGIAVEDITSEKKRSPHKLTPFARVEGARVTYPGEATLFESGE